MQSCPTIIRMCCNKIAKNKEKYKIIKCQEIYETLSQFLLSVENVIALTINV